MSETEPTRRRWQAAAPGVTPGVVLLLAAWGVVTWMHLGRSMWADEAWVVEFAHESSMSAALSRVVNEHQPIAPGYLALLHGVARLAPGNITALRVVTAVLSLPLFLCVVLLAGRLARSWVWGCLAALALLACPLVQRYLTEIKQYLPEAGLTLALIVAARWWAAPGGSRGWQALALWLALALLAVACTFAAWFAVAGTWGVMAGAHLVQRRARATTSGPSPGSPKADHPLPGAARTPQGEGVGPPLLAGLIVVAAAAVVYLSFVRPIAADANLRQYWAGQFVAVDWTLPVAIWRGLAELWKQAWYRYEAPGMVLLALSLLGGIAWAARQPVVATAALVTVLLTLLANVAGRWPLGVRINLPLVVLLHLGLLAGPLSFVSWHAEESGDAPSAATGDAVARRSRRLFSPLAALLLAVLLTAGLIWETRTADYETARVDRMLDQLATLAGPQDLVILDPTAAATQRFAPRPIAARIERGPWPAEDSVLRDYLPLIAPNLPATRPADGRGAVYLAAGHHNEALEAAWKKLGQELAPHGRFTRLWSDRNVAIYRFEPRGVEDR